MLSGQLFGGSFHQQCDSSAAPQLGVQDGFSRFRSVVARFIFFSTKFEWRETTSDSVETRQKARSLGGNRPSGDVCQGQTSIFRWGNRIRCSRTLAAQRPAISNALWSRLHWRSRRALMQPPLPARSRCPGLVCPGICGSFYFPLAGWVSAALLRINIRFIWNVLLRIPEERQRN